MDELKTPQNTTIQKDEARKGREKDDEPGLSQEH